MEEEKKKCDKDCQCSKQDEHKDCACEHEKNKKKDKYKEKIKELEDMLQEKENVIKDLEDKIKYHQAELINYRKRKEEETENRLKYANQDLISELLIILDNFERAIKLDDNNLNDELSKFLKGFKMMYASLDDLLKKYGLEEIEAFHKEYDPNVMEALMTDNDPEFKDDEVLEVLLKGYKLKDRIIRPASVRVNKLEIEESNNTNEKGEDNNE